MRSRRIGPPTTPPNWLRRNFGLTGLVDAKKLRAFSDLVPEELEGACRATSLVPDFVVRLTTPPLKRPNSAGGLLLSILNSWIASMFGKERDLAGLGLQHRDAVEQVLVGARPAAVDARQRRGRRQRDAGDQAGEGDEAAAVQRQVDDLPVVDHLSETGAFRPQQRRVGRHGDRLGHRADGELQVEPHGLAGGEPIPSRVSGRNPLNSTRRS